MGRKEYFYITLGIVTLGVMALFSMGGYHWSPQSLRLVTGESQTVANGRAVITAGQIGYDVQLEIHCKKEHSSLTLDIDADPSEKVCGIQVRVLEVSEARFGAPSANLKVSWDK